MDTAETATSASIDTGGSRLLRAAAYLISYLFHPVFIPVLVSAFLLFIHPYLFSGFTPLLKLQRLTTVFFNMTFIPGFAVFLMWRLKLIPSMHLRTSKERIIPYATAIIFYFWCWYAMSRQADSPQPFVNFLQGSFLGVCGAWIININSKISMHTTAMGGLLMFFILFSFSDPHGSTLYLAAALLIAGLVTTARNLVSGHSRLEIIQGLIVGLLSMLVAWML
jgi:hypothetical protein